MKQQRRALLQDPRGLRVTIMGLGLHGGGIATAEYFARRGATVTVTDTKTENELSSSIQRLAGYPIRYHLGGHRMEDFSGADLVLKNPAVPADNPYLQASSWIETDISVFLTLTEPRLIAVTGSKGKSTVVSAIHHILKAVYPETLLGGNIKVSPLTFLDQVKKGTPVVLELSSWQLADLRGRGVLDPEISVVTNLMHDHQNRYKSMEDYAADKREIYAGQSAERLLITSHDDPYCRAFGDEHGPPLVRIAAENASFSKEGPDRDGNPSVAGAAGHAFLEANEGVLLYEESKEVLVPEQVMVPGRHQKLNLLFAAAACRHFGMDGEQVRREAAGFPGIPHRLEPAGRAEGVSYINDTAATIPEAAEAAVDSLIEAGPVILITGGTDKQLDFTPLISAAGRCKALVLLAGSGTEKLMSGLDEKVKAPSGKPPFPPCFGPFQLMEEAVRAASSLAENGDQILLSPGCASFEWFENEFDRGKQFLAAVQKRTKTVTAYPQTIKKEKN
ncbi:MAG: UDP-N-acetylmuramoyl-L-alanine--D-glutamate ligase [Spirochaetales bacterium]|nr:UDP-N-acetylmuramoyl-L-alanine--D-glutamate ligase [Spirochaetales bacterium]MCF7937867.1 UDP-N-acetylmuramoyl-L-alanine--D-glutamate ligase [Spirochaetales bacterium]